MRRSPLGLRAAGALLWLAAVRSQAPRDVLASPPRRRVYERVLAEPGISMTRLAQSLQMHWAGVQFHVGHLAAAGLVRSVRAGRRRLVFPREALEGAWMEERALLAEPSCRRLAVVILEHPGRDVLQLAELTGQSPRAVYHHARRLRDAGLVTTGTSGRYRGVRATPKLFGLLL